METEEEIIKEVDEEYQLIDESEKRKLIGNYFKSSGGFGLIFIGIIVIFISLMDIEELALILLVGLFLVMVGILSRGKSATDEEMDLWLEEDYERLEKTGMNKLGLVKDQLVGDTITIAGFLFPGMKQAEGISDNNLPPLAKKVGKDGKLRLGSYWFQCIFLTKDYIASYGTALDFINGHNVREISEEFFYLDVVRVGTNVEDWTGTDISGKTTYVRNAEKFSLTVSSGDSIEVYLPSQKLVDEWGGGKAKYEVPTSDAEKAVQTIRVLLREKKS